MEYEQQKTTPKISSEEWTKYANIGDKDSIELAQWMAEKGISFDSGYIEVELDGKIEKMNTSRDDFGTVLEDDDTVLEQK